ncbi:hypothetical protein EX30DRAFT_324099 [Ascodesmis nigricans]|uniref:Myb-like DNA-binding domain-containing protein n=1 Tax=Ascodesmis nigricans TaxID=341454 RepID=A0A4S2MJ95_9PEZI|nr:hypothetical protein EX30DRAFT_324099 [Ascodesmis nigricans]
MPAAISDSDTVRFLVAVIECTNNGKPDFTKVQQLLNLPSSGAARERYRRIIQKHGLSSKASSSTSGTTSAPSAPATPRKRKAENPSPESRRAPGNGTVEGQGQEAAVTPPATPAGRKVRRKNVVVVKAEPQQQQQKQQLGTGGRDTEAGMWGGVGAGCDIDWRVIA